MIKHSIFKDPSVNKPVAILASNRDFDEKLVREHYIIPLIAAGIPEEDIIIFNLEHEQRGKISVTKAREYLEKLKPILDNIGVETILCCDGPYFKALTKATVIEKHLSYRMDSLWPEQDVFYCPTFRQVFFNPEVTSKIKLAIKGLSAHRAGKGGIFDDSILINPYYPQTAEDIKQALRGLLKHMTLTCDIETFDLHVKDAGLGTIAFAWNKHNGVAFAIDHSSQHGTVVRKWLLEFFVAYTEAGGKLIYHGGSFDIKILIWEVFMTSPTDIDGMLHGLDIMFRLFEDTKSLSYLATNTAAGNSLGLKSQAFEYVGNYAIDVIDIRKHHVDKVLEYNLIDACATWYVYDKHRANVHLNQEYVYQKVFKPSLKTITQMELTGLPLNIGQVLNAEIELDDIRFTALEGLRTSVVITKFTKFLRILKAEKETAKLKKLVKTEADYLDLEFNPNSNPQVSLLLYQELKLPVINKTDKGNPSCDAKTLEALLAHENKAKKPRADVITLIEHLQHYAEVDILLTTFIPAFKSKNVEKDGWRYLLGNFNLGGTKSGRLSSSDPNLQNTPSTGTRFAKTIKKCFQAPPWESDPTKWKHVDDKWGWIFVGADYFSLEDRISALLTKDPNKLKVYTDGFDGHCLRAYGYFAAKMPDITIELAKATTGTQRASVINSIEDLYPDLRQDSKGPTFALTYMGTWRTLVKTFGIPKTEAVQIEKNYHDLYVISDNWVKSQIALANQLGYVELAFGLRLRTPLLPQVILSSYDSMPYEAYKEIKTAANALGQSYGLLNSFSGNMFMEQVWAHPRFRTWILPCAQIHDSQYYMVKNHLGCLEWVNNHLVKCMEWADLDPIRHPEVGLGSQLEVYWPDWSNPIKLPNRASPQEILDTLEQGKLEWTAQQQGK